MEQFVLRIIIVVDVPLDDDDDDDDGKRRYDSFVNRVSISGKWSRVFFLLLFMLMASVRDTPIRHDPSFSVVAAAEVHDNISLGPKISSRLATCAGDRIAHDSSSIFLSLLLWSPP